MNKRYEQKRKHIHFVSGQMQMQIKSIMRYCFHMIRLVKIVNADNTKWNEDME